MKKLIDSEIDQRFQNALLAYGSGPIIREEDALYQVLKGKSRNLINMLLRTLNFDTKRMGF